MSKQVLTILQIVSSDATFRKRLAVDPNLCRDYLSDAEEVYQLEVVTGDLFGTLTKITAYIRADADMMNLVNDLLQELNCEENSNDPQEVIEIL